MLKLNIIGGPVLWALFAIAGLLVLALLLHRRSARRTVVTVATVAGSGILAFTIIFLVSDVWDVFGVQLSLVTKAWGTAVFMALALAIDALFFTRTRRRVLAIVAIPLCVLAAAAGINADFGEYPTLGNALGITGFRPISLPTTSPTVTPPGADIPVSTVAPRGVLTGSVGTVIIPATVSGFAARPAVVYIPAIAQTAHPPILPVVVMLSGQPGSPSDIFTSGRLASILDAYAVKHKGAAPIVVVPDQLGGPYKNPMCVDSALGNSATYITVDVTRWIRSHFAVPAGSTGWTIAGFSQGGTCSIQLGAAHPNLYSTILDISGEIMPKVGAPGVTIAKGFAGSAALYAAAAPAAILAAHAPYTDHTIIFAAGANDAKYTAWARTLAAAASAASMTTQLLSSPGTAHDWHTVQYAWTKALPVITSRSGLDVTP